jgi:molybdopterin-guanine dinucleotide biosynthesis protein A
VKYKMTGVILASGEGSRMRALSKETGLPKHLFPLGKTTVISRIAQDLARFCDEVICIIPAPYITHFSKELQERIPGVRLAVKKIKGFKGDFTAAYEESKYDHILLTVGDLVFPDGEIEIFAHKADLFGEKLVLAFDRNRLRVLKFPTIIDFRMILARLPREILKTVIELDPESPVSVVKGMVRLIIKNKLRVIFSRTLFNLNTPEVYEKAKSFFNT